MSREKLKKFSVAEIVKAVREVRGFSITEMAYALGVSEASARHYESGRREPDRHLLRRLAEIAPKEMRGEIEERLPESFRGLISVRISGRRYKEETVVEAHAALDAILDHARSDVVEKVLGDLTKFAGRFGDEK